MRYLFKIPVGDWSGDGHGKCKWFTASATRPIEAVREAYFMAKEKLKGLDPESFCNKYGYDGEDVCMTDEAREKLFKLGAPIQPVNEDGDYEFGPEEMARIIVWFLNQGDPDLAVLHVSEDLPMLPFYGYDEKHRHIDFMGYGLF